MTNLNSTLKTRDITLPTKVRLVKAMVFPVVMYGHDPDDMGCPGFSSCCFTEIDVPIDLRWVSQGISGLL